jgi:hypothetical protein
MASLPFAVLILICICSASVESLHVSNVTATRGNHQHVKSHAHKTFENAVRTYDKDILHSALNLIDTMKIEIKGFYHVATTVGHWNEVLEEHLMVMDGKRFATNLFSTKASADPAHKQQKNSIGMKLSTGWSSVLEIADSIELNFDAATDPDVPTHPPDGSPLESIAYQNMTTMLTSLHLRGGSEKVHVKPYSAAVLPSHTTSGANLRKSSKSTPTTVGASKQSSDRRELATVLGEINSINELYAYCKSRVTAQKQSYVFLMHNQETNCTSDFMRHISAEVLNCCVIEWSLVGTNDSDALCCEPTASATLRGCSFELTYLFCKFCRATTRSPFCTTSSTLSSWSSPVSASWRCSTATPRAVATSSVVPTIRTFGGKLPSRLLCTL